MPGSNVHSIFVGLPVWAASWQMLWRGLTAVTMRRPVRKLALEESDMLDMS